MPATGRYNRAFFEKIEAGSLASARQIVPTLMALLHPKSVADIGCGRGAWLSVFRDSGVDDVWGVDGGELDPRELLFPAERFRSADLSRPLAAGRRFDLVLSLEVGEHLPALSAASYVGELTGLSDVVVFSAAIPNQGGEGHLNEQWPEYWKALFEARGFVLIDCLRQRFWNNRRIERWYRQNMVLFVRADRLPMDPQLAQEYEKGLERPLDLVHPATYSAPSLSALPRMAMGSLARALRRRIGEKP